MNRRPDGAAVAQILAYVDDCLPEEDKAAFEARMASDPEIRRRVEQWLQQNEAVRAAYSDRPLRLVSRLAGASVSAPAVRGRPAPLPRGNQAGRRPGPSAVDDGPRPASEAAPAPRYRWAATARRMGWVSAAGMLLTVASAALLADHSPVDFLKAGVAAYRTYAGGASKPVEMATPDRAALKRWFLAQIGRAAAVPDLSSSGLSLIGGRIAPGANAPAQLVVYESARRERVVLDIETFDAPSDSAVEISESGGLASAVWTGAGRRFALIGAPRSELPKIAELARRGEAGE